MNYLKNLAINFLVVFFSNHLLPGIEMTHQAKLPHVGGDLIFAFVLGLLNSLIYTALRIIHGSASGLKIAIVCLILNFAAYAIVKLIPIGIQVQTVEGYVLAAAIVSIGSFLANFFEMKHRNSHHTTDIPS
jgi:uncharacterized membrane protein YvlD (DUF360 family)